MNIIIFLTTRKKTDQGSPCQIIFLCEFVQFSTVHFLSICLLFTYLIIMTKKNSIWILNPHFDDIDINRDFKSIYWCYQHGKNYTDNRMLNRKFKILGEITGIPFDTIFLIKSTRILSNFNQKILTRPFSIRIQPDHFSQCTHIIFFKVRVTSTMIFRNRDYTANLQQMVRVAIDSELRRNCATFRRKIRCAA